MAASTIVQQSPSFLRAFTLQQASAGCSAIHIGRNMVLNSGFIQSPLLLIIRIHSARARNGLERYRKGSRNARYCQTSWLNNISPLDRHNTRSPLFLICTLVPLRNLSQPMHEKGKEQREQQIRPAGPAQRSSRPALALGNFSLDFFALPIPCAFSLFALLFSPLFEQLPRECFLLWFELLAFSGKSEMNF